ncbi:MAG: alpha-ketoglutarate-dependent dioxygenase AlkB [Enterobacterales bacterium]|nr:alpha-ketoglutarate-dependent dioxygenase AlkB [Enterobacterales bacterium]
MPNYQSDLFSALSDSKEQIYPDVYRLSRFTKTDKLHKSLGPILQHSPFRKMMTPNGHYTNIAFTNCGEYGWVSNKVRYQYLDKDPLNNQPWPPMPQIFKDLAANAALEAGYSHFMPDSCLINQYLIGSKLGSHQDKNEKDFNHPIVSVSIGLTAIFQIYGKTRSGIKAQFPLYDGDVMVWGDSARLMYHGVKSLTAAPLKPNLTQRVNLTFRKSH